MVSRPVTTYSIVAIDKKSGEMGAAVQSHWFSVGSVVTWAEPGVGVVATQSFVEASYGPLGLALMKGGKTSQQALKSLLATDPRPEVRQVAMLDAQGRVAVHTGDKCLPEAGHVLSRGFTTQANLMRNRRIWRAMASAFRRTKGRLALRLLAALEAAEEAGGDVRGKQSAAMLIVKTKSGSNPWQDRILDLRVEDNPTPLKELRRLVRIHEAYTHANTGDDLMTKGMMEGAIAEYRAASELAPEIEELKFWQGVTLLNRGAWEDAIRVLKKVFVANKDWKQVIKTLPKFGLLSIDRRKLNEILRA